MRDQDLFAAKCSAWAGLGLLVVWGACAFVVIGSFRGHGSHQF